MDDRGSLVKIDKLTDTNFYVWKQKIQLLLALRDLDEYIDCDTPAETSENYKSWLRADSKARAIISLSLSDDHLEHVRDCTTAKQTWLAILNVFERHTLLNKLAARRDFYTVQMHTSESVLQFVNRVKQLAARLKTMSVVVDDKEMAMAVLNGLPDRFHSLIVALDALGNEQKDFGLDYVKSRLLQEEQRASMNGSGVAKSTQSALLSSQLRRPSSLPPLHCANCGHDGHSAERCWGKDINGRRPSRPAGYLPRKAGTSMKATTSERSAGLVAKEPDEEYVCLVASSAPINSALHQLNARGESTWLVDSGCTSHITFDRSLFSTYEHVSDGSVEMGTKATAAVVGRGNVYLRLKVNGKCVSCVLKDVLHVPDFEYSLLSVSKMSANGLDVVFDNSTCSIRSNERVIATASLVGSLYVLDVYGTTASAHMASLQTWHERFSHVNKPGILSMSRNNVVSGLDVCPNLPSSFARSDVTDSSCNADVCPACVLGKTTRALIPRVRSTPRSSAPLQLVHSDVCGPLQVQSVGGARYFITFVDDYTNWVSVYVLRQKSEAYSKYTLFKSRAELHTERKVKVLRTDRGGEYLSNEFAALLEKDGTQHQLTTAHTPHQNGVAERMNRTLMDLVRAMLAAKNISKRFWAEALVTAVYARNRATSKALPVNNTPFELWMGRKPDVSHLRVFGSRCWYKQNHTETQKLDARAREAMFLGYPENSKAYKLWDFDRGKVEISRDVVFDEAFERANDNAIGSRGGLDLADISFDSQKCVVLDMLPYGEPELDDVSKTIMSSSSAKSGQIDAIEEFQNNFFPQNESPTVNNAVPEPGNPSAPRDMPPESTTQDTSGPRTHSNPESPTLHPAPRRSTRVRRAPSSWWKALLSASPLSSNSTVPLSYRAAVTGPRASFWQTGIDRELASQTKNKTWVLVPRSSETNVLTSRWVFSTKQLPTPSGDLVETAKARLVARGFQQIEGVDYNETFAPVIKFATLRMVLALVAHFDLELHQMDVVTAFLNGDLDEDIYMEQPDGCIDKRRRDWVCKLQKALYGLKQSPRKWHEKVDQFLIEQLGFVTARSDPCLYIKRDKDALMVIALYVDDLLLAGKDMNAIAWMKSEFSKRFEMKDLGEAHKCIGLEISRNRNTRTLYLSQHTYATSVLERFKMSNCNPCATPMELCRPPIDASIIDPPTNCPYRQAIGCLMFLMVGTRPDLSFTVGRLAQSCEQPRQSDWNAVKRVLRYVQGTKNVSLKYVGSADKPSISGYSDADWAGCVKSRKSTSGYVFMLCGGAVSWCSRKQSVLAASSCEAEYIALTETCKEAAWLRRMIADVLGLDNDPTLNVSCDNDGTIASAHNESINRRNKHIDIAYHFARDASRRNIVRFVPCASQANTADILTKPLARVLFERCFKKMGLINAS